jgi:hypothetical protein
MLVVYTEEVRPVGGAGSAGMDQIELGLTFGGVVGEDGSGNGVTVEKELGAALNVNEGDPGFVLGFDPTGVAYGLRV